MAAFWKYFKKISSPSASRCEIAIEQSMKTRFEELKAAQLKLALLVEEDRVYVPIFERINQEIAKLEQEEDAIARAKAIAASYKARG